METSDNKDTRQNNNMGNNAHNRSGRVWGGLALIIIGGAFMARQAGADLPYWIFSGWMIPIAIGFFIGARQSFRPGIWLIAIAIGVAFMIDDFYPEIDMRHFIWPSIIIGAGLLMIFRPRGSRRDRWDNWKHEPLISSTDDSDEVLDMVSVFGGNKRNVITKNFKGGEAVSVFGGTELILTQADFTGTVTLELTQVFGGAKLIVPANWKIQSQQVVSIFGALDDKRPQSADGADSTKVLKLIGTSIFGGIEIKSY